MSRSTHLTIQDFAGLPEDDGSCYELIDGALHVSIQPYVEHQIVVDAMCGLLRSWNRQSGIGGLAVSNLLIIFDQHEAMAPDVVWFSRERLLAARHPDGRLHGAPDLVIEVLASGIKNEKRDRKIKPARYASWAVRSYWIVDRFARRVEIYRLDGTTFRHSVSFGTGETLTSPVLPGFVCPVSDLFADLPV